MKNWGVEWAVYVAIVVACAFGMDHWPRWGDYFGVLAVATTLLCVWRSWRIFDAKD